MKALKYVALIIVLSVMVTACKPAGTATQKRQLPVPLRNARPIRLAAPCSSRVMSSRSAWAPP